MQKKKHYLSNKDLYYHIVVSQAKGKLTSEAQHMLILLTKNVIKKMYYKNPDDRLDCFQEAIYDILKGWYNFDPLKGDNCFSYYTEIIKRGLAKSWNHIHRTKGADVDIISICAMNEHGEVFDRF